MFHNAIRLDQRIAVYVPATSGVSTACDNSAMVEKCAALLSELFGGATIQPGRGAWVSETAGLVLEETTIVYSYTTAENLEKYVGKVEAFAMDMKAAMKQEAVSVEINNCLFLV